MILFNAILVGLKEVWAHKFRSLLTMLGIILGVASLVGMGALVKGMENGMKETMIATGGANKVWLQEQEVPTWQQELATEATGRTMRDVYALQDSAPLLKLVSPEMEVDRAIISRGGKSVRASECVGAWPAVLDMNLHTLEHGRFFNELDEERAANVCVIGTGIRDELFGSPEETGKEIVPLGKTVFIQDQPFVIVGMLKHYETERERKEREMGTNEKKPTEGPARRRGWRHRGAFWGKNHTVYMPLNTAWLRFLAAEGNTARSDDPRSTEPITPDPTGTIPVPRLTALDLKVVSLDKLEEALQQARNVLMITHHGIEDFTFQTQENQIESISTQIRNARLSGGIIACIALLVGGIGIMNIMLASIQERVREIGICKAIGAGSAAIFAQVLMESLVLALMGAALGVGASFGMVAILNHVSPGQTTPVIEPNLMLIAVGCSAVVGVVAGLFPAMKAARLNPIQALRFE